jgi:hypothetical protein
MTGQDGAARYSHLLEVMDGAAALAMAIRQAEAALMEPGLGGEDRELLEAALEASRRRFEHVIALLARSEREAVDLSGSLVHGGGVDLTPEELLDAARAAEEGSSTAEHVAVRAIDRVGRSFDLGSREILEGFLSHGSPLLRAGSMKVLALHWRLPEYSDRVCWSLASDEDVDCRRAAALCLGSLYEGTRDPAIGAELVSALQREGEEEGVRWACYLALRALDGGAEPLPPSTVGSFEPGDADEDLLQRYRRPGQYEASS